MAEFEICYTEHELKWLRVRAKTKEDAIRKFNDGELDLSEATGYGDYGEPTINNVKRLH